MRDSIVFYRSFWEAINELPDEDQLAAFRAIIGYAIYGDEPEVAGLANALFLMAKPQIDANNQRFASGKKGGAPPKNSNAKKAVKTTDGCFSKITKTTDGCFLEENKNNQKQPNVNVNENVNVNANEKIKRFRAPTREEVREYCEERENGIDPDLFVDHYESNGWNVGKTKMKDWKASVRIWERNRRPGETNTAKREDSVAESFLKGGSDYDA